MKKLLYIFLFAATQVNAQMPKHQPRPVSVSGGGISAQNLLYYSEQMGNATYWPVQNVTVTQNSGNDVNGNNTMNNCLLTSDLNSWCRQQVTGLTPSTTYYFSFDVTRGVGTSPNLNWSVYDISNGVDLFSTNYYSSTSSTVTRIQLSFTTPSGCTSIYLYPIHTLSNSISNSGYVYLGRMQLATSSLAPYITTTNTIYP